MKAKTPALFRPKPLSGTDLKNAATYILSIPAVLEVEVYSSNSDSTVVYVIVVPHHIFEDFIQLVKNIYLDKRLRELRNEQVRLEAFDVTYPEFKEWRQVNWPSQSDVGVDVLFMPTGWKSHVLFVEVEYFTERQNYIQNLAAGEPLYSLWK